MNWKTKTLLIGGIAGVLAGILAAVLLIQNAEKEQRVPQISAGDGVKVGIGLMGLLKMISDL